MVNKNLAKGNLVYPGHGEGLDADTVDGLHLQQILDKARMYGGGGLWYGDLALEKPYSFLVFTRTISGTIYYYAQYGSGSDQAGKIAYGGPGNAGGVSGIDASAVIRAALNALTSGRTWLEKVVLKSNFTTTTAIQIYSYTVLEIQGRITLANNADCNVIESEPSDRREYIYIIGGIIDGNKDSQASGDGIDLWASRSSIKDVAILNAKTYGIHYRGTVAKTVSVMRIENVYIALSGNSNIVSDTYTASTQIINALLGPTVNYSIWLKYGSARVVGVTTWGDQTTLQGIRVETSGAEIVGTEVLNMKNYGIYLTGIDYVVSGCFLKLNDYAGIWLKDCNRATVVGNSLWDNRLQGIKLDGTSIDNVIDGNAVSESDLYGINLDAVDDNIVIGNRIRSATGGAIGVRLTAGADRNRIEHNNLLNVAVAISDAGTGTITKFNTGFVTENSGTSTGTGAQQTIPHGCAFTPTYDEVFLSERSTGGALAYQSAAPDATNIYVTATNLKTYNWKVEKA